MIQVNLSRAKFLWPEDLARASPKGHGLWGTQAQLWELRPSCREHLLIEVWGGKAHERRQGVEWPGFVYGRCDWRVRVWNDPTEGSPIKTCCLLYFVGTGQSNFLNLETWIKCIFKHWKTTDWQEMLYLVELKRFQQLLGWEGSLMVLIALVQQRLV